jgi:predicted nucleic acid-binding protein
VRVHYLDSSVWVKRYFEERGSERVHELFRGKEALASSWLGCVEVSAAIARQAGARRIDEATRRQMEGQLDYEWSRFLQAGAGQEEYVSAVGLARKYGLRGADAVHLAIVKELTEGLRERGDELVFWTADGELSEAGRATGLVVENPLDRT